MRKLFLALTFITAVVVTVEARRTVALVDHAVGNGVNGTTLIINDAAANFAINCFGFYSGITPNVTGFTDSLGASYTGTAQYTTGTPTKVQCAFTYALSGGNPHQLTTTAVSTYMGGGFAAFSGVYSSGNPYDGEQGTTVASTNVITTPSLTCTEDNCIYISAVMFEDNSAGAVSVNGGFSIIDTKPFGAGTNEGLSWAYLVQGCAAAVTPQWDVTNSTAALAAVTVAFKGPGGSCGGGGGSTFRPKVPIIIMNPRESR